MAADPSSRLIKARRCLRSAQALLGGGDPDGACNRAYYAMYDAAQAALLVLLGTEAASYKSHRGLIGAFGAHVVMRGLLNAEFGRAINEVQRFRQLADYTGETIDHEKAAVAVTRAEAFVQAVQTKFIALGA